MTTKVTVDLIGLLLIALIAWYFWFSHPKGVQVAEFGGIQEVTIKVKGGYNPDVIMVKRGKPVRLNFIRQESSLCSEMVIFDKLGQSARLPEGETIAIEFIPEQKGEIPFQCQMGMLKGKVIVH